MLVCLYLKVKRKLYRDGKSLYNSLFIQSKVFSFQPYFTFITTNQELKCYSNEKKLNVKLHLMTP